MQGNLYVGTSGWIYKEWAGVFYPKDLKNPGELAHYAKTFDTVEINATFYRLPFENMVKGWYQRSPKKFIFAVKGSRYITHIKRLKARAPNIKKFFDRARLLKEKCGPILWQLPPNFHYDPKLLEKFLGKLPKEYRHAFEFRHVSWYENEKTFEILRAHKVSHVLLSSLRMPQNLTITTDFVYIRFHGLEGGPHHDYTNEELQPWATYSKRWLKDGFSVYAYFNNDLNTRAPWNAIAFREMITGKRNDRTKTVLGTTPKSEDHSPSPRGRG
jgi:uncharacterized protein YecE (DUF72 family)